MKPGITSPETNAEEACAPEGRGNKQQPNAPTSASAPAGYHDCNSDAMAGFTAVHGLAHVS
jgi:hypothetical protein